MLSSRRFLFSLVTIACLGFNAQQARAQSSNDILTLPNGDLLLLGHKDHVPWMAIHTATWVEQPNPEGAPAKGEYTAACTDRLGNLYLAFEDEGNPKKDVHGLLKRVNGAWSALPALPKGWSSIYDPVAMGPDAIWFRSWHDTERRTVMVRWDGKSYTELPLPPGTKEMHALLLDADGTLIADGDMNNDAGAYRFVNNAWTPMGEAMDGMHVDRFVYLSDGTLVCNVARSSYSDAKTALYRWEGNAWKPLKGADVPMKQDVVDLCAGPDGRLYLLIEAGDEAGDPQRLACWKEDRLRWYKGTPESAVQKDFSGMVHLYNLACDRTGLLHARTYRAMVTFSWAEFDRAMDGYPQQDASAAALWSLFQRLEPDYYTKTGALVAAYRNYKVAINEANSKRVSSASAALKTWAGAAMDSVGRIAPKRMNRLADRFTTVLELWRKSAESMAAQLAGNAAGKDQEEQDHLKTQAVLALGNVRDAQELLDAELEAYAKRNALAARVVPASFATRDGYPAKDERAAEVFTAQQANIGEWNAFMSASDRWVHFIGTSRNAATGMVVLQDIHDNYRPWVLKEKARMEALGMPPDRNRLYDAYMKALLEGMYLMNTIEGLGDIITGSYAHETYNEAVERFHDAHREVNYAVLQVEGLIPAYQVRNGL